MTLFFMISPLTLLINIYNLVSLIYVQNWNVLLSLLTLATDKWIFGLSFIVQLYDTSACDRVPPFVALLDSAFFSVCKSN